MKEIELLYRLKLPVEVALKKLAHISESIKRRTVDTYYFDPQRPLLKPDSEGKTYACLRVRMQGRVAYLTFKSDVYASTGEWTYSDELETRLESGNIAKKIVSKLGLKKLVVVDNTKHIFNTEKYEIVIEDVKDLGGFIEIESKFQVKDSDVQKCKQDMRDFLAGLKLTLGEEENAGKPELLLKQRRSNSVAVKKK